MPKDLKANFKVAHLKSREHFLLVKDYYNHEVLRVSRERSMIIHEYKLSGKVLATVDSAKYLGFTNSADLRWNKHIDDITSKANRTLCFLKRNLRVSSTTVKTSAYYSLVRPTLEMLVQPGIHTYALRKTSINWKWCNEGQLGLYLADTTIPRVSQKCCRNQIGCLFSEQRRQSQRLAMLYN